jgi:hypothetical protein
VAARRRRGSQARGHTITASEPRRGDAQRRARTSEARPLRSRSGGGGGSGARARRAARGTCRSAAAVHLHACAAAPGARRGSAARGGATYARAASINNSIRSAEKYRSRPPTGGGRRTADVTQASEALRGFEACFLAV